jgi:hypothetical protein
MGSNRKLLEAHVNPTVKKVMKIAGIEVTDAEWMKLKDSVYRVWNDVAFDACSEGELPYSHAMELCLDADRLLTNADDKESNELVSKICKAGGYRALNRRLCKEIKLSL